MAKKKPTAKASSAISNYINHIVFVVDRSGSMGGLVADVIKVFDSQINFLASRSQELDQETRVSVYLFDNVTENIIYDKDVLRLPSLRDHYQVRGSTAMIDATMKGVEDLEKTPELYGDHAFLVYVLTDGEENASHKHTVAALNKKLSNLPDNWTVAALVPNASGRSYAEQFGFPKENISIWSTTSKGMTDVGEVIRKATNNFMENRAKGIRGSRTLFQLDTSQVNKRTVKATLDPLDISAFHLYDIKARDGIQIRDFVEKKTRKDYVKGSAYYQLTKKENVQSYKNLCLKEISTGKVYTGDAVRDLLGLPDHEVRIEPADHPQFSFFIQSTSYNRKLVPGTELLVLR